MDSYKITIIRSYGTHEREVGRITMNVEATSEVMVKGLANALCDNMYQTSLGYYHYEYDKMEKTNG